VADSIDPNSIPLSVAVVDDDQLVRNLVTNYCRAIGITEIEAFESGDAAWSALANGKHFDMVILDWKLPGLSGVGLFNRMRSHPELRRTPMLVISGFLNQNDFALLEEFPCTGLLEKPFTKILLERKVKSLWEESQWYLDKSKMLDDLVRNLHTDGSNSVKELKKLLGKSPNPIALALLIAKKLRKAGFLKDAKSFLETVFLHDSTSVAGMTEMAKVLFQMGDVAKARDVLRITNRISPENVRRLCLLGEVELNLNDPEAARKCFEDALEIDPDDSLANSGLTVANSIADHLVEYSKDAIPTNFASMLNIVAITKVRAGKFEDGISQYMAALAFLRSDLVLSKVSFNLGLGFLRWQKPELAKKWFEKSAALSKGKFTRAEGYLGTGKASHGNGDSKLQISGSEEDGDLFEVTLVGPD
jgi:CheY-like chemotaxis protein/predicted negative regulator of RcsB-dependent stress response